MGKSRKVWHCLRENSLILITVICVFIGVALGVLLKLFNVGSILKLYIALPGELFMRALYFSVLPLLACNIIAMSAKLKPSTHGVSALLSLAYCILMNHVGSFIGLGVTLLIRPGEKFNSSQQDLTISVSGDKIELSDMFPDFLRNMVPDNIMKTLLQSTVTTHIRKLPAEGMDTNETSIIYQRNVGVSNGPNVLGILTSSLVLGLVAGSRLEKTQPFIALAEAVTEVMTILTEKIVKLLPFAMISLIASALSSVGNLESGLITVGLFAATSVVFNLILSIVVFPVFYAIVVRRNLFTVYKVMYGPLITAFSTTSSLVTLPDLFKACEQLGVEPHIVRTIAPFLTSFNANGSAAFISSAVCFSAQVAGFPLHVVQLIGIGFLSGLNVMALPAVPSASIITIFLIIRIFQIPEFAVSLLFIVEFINDRLRTVINVMSHGTCILFVHWKWVHRQSDRPDPIMVQSVYNDGELTENNNKVTENVPNGFSV